jgi:hypothetical protein
VLPGAVEADDAAIRPLQDVQTDPGDEGDGGSEQAS